MKKLLLLCILIVAVSCASNPNEEKQQSNEVDTSLPVIGKYVYVDANQVSHIYSHCSVIVGLFTSEDNTSHNSSLRRILVDTINRRDLEQCCSYCISDSIYEALMLRAYKY